MTAPFVNSSQIAIPVTVAAATHAYAASDVPLVIDIEGDTDLLPFLSRTGNDLIVTDDEGTILPFDRRMTRIAERGEFGWSVALAQNAKAIGDLRVLGYYDIANADWRVGAWNVDTEAWTSTKLLDAPGGQKDDHNNGTIDYDSDGYIYVFCAEHNTAVLRVFKSDSPNDISAFTQIADLDSQLSGTATKSYAAGSILRDDAGDKFFLFYRNNEAASTRPRYLTTSTDGVTWTTPVKVIEVTGQRPYPQYGLDQTRKRVHICFTPYGWNEGTNANGDMYHAYIQADVSPMTLHETDGTLIGNVGTAVLNESNATLADNTAFYKWPMDDVMTDEDGHPVFPSSEIRDANAKDLRTRYSRWTGTEWNSREMLAEGQSMQLQSISTGYPRGMTLLDADTFFGLRRVTNAETEIVRMTTSDEGETFTTEVILRPARDAFRLVAFKGASGADPCVLAFMHGYYKEFSYSGTVPRSKCDIGLWPLAGEEADIVLAVEIDTDGATDQTLYLQAGGVAHLPTAPFSGTLYKAFGEVANFRLSESNTLMNSLAACTVLTRFRKRADTASINYLLSDIPSGGTAANSHVAQRLTAGEALACLWSNGTAFHTHTSTGLVTTPGNWDVAVSRFNGTANTANSLTGAALHTAAHSLGSTLNNAASADAGPYLGESLHGTSAYLDGDLGAHMSWPTAKTDDWMRAAGLAAKGDQYTLGTPEEPAVAPIGGFFRPLGKGGILGEA